MPKQIEASLANPTPPVVTDFETYRCEVFITVDATDAFAAADYCNRFAAAISNGPSGVRNAFVVKR